MQPVYCGGLLKKLKKKCVCILTAVVVFKAFIVATWEQYKGIRGSVLRRWGLKVTLVFRGLGSLRLVLRKLVED